MKLTVMVIALIVTTLYAEQFVWIDDTFTFSSGRICNVTESGTPNNFVNPVNYKDGMVYLRAEVVNKPTDHRMCLQMCIWEGGETCMYHTLTQFSSTGDVGYGKQSPGSWWTKSSHNWSTGSNSACIVLKDPASNLWVDGCGGSHCMGSSASQHLPVKLHVTAIVTSAGSSLQLPEGADWQCPDSWGCDPMVAAGKPVLSGSHALLFHLQTSDEGIALIADNNVRFEAFDVRGRSLAIGQAADKTARLAAAAAGIRIIRATCAERVAGTIAAQW